MKFDWADLAFGSKKPLKQLKATFIAAPRDASTERLKQLLKEYLPKGNVVLGISKEPYVVGLENQPQFRMLKAKDVESIVAQVEKSSSPNKLYVLNYSQRELKHIFEKPLFSRVVLVNGSWHYAFHTQALYYALVQSGMPYEYCSAFTDEAEALAYERAADKQITSPVIETSKTYSQAELLLVASQAATLSYDHTFQTGVALAEAKPEGYSLLAWAYNKVVPYQTYALLNGASREKHLSPPNDLNHYDTVHAETMLVVNAARDGVDLKGKSLFINLLPCPTCARMLSQTDIAEVVYTQDHSDGYAVKMLEASGKKVRRLVP